ncbi:short-chain dehydrogenase/reductase SDR [Caldalkalibacillus thermarum TA2.A1]|uniref:SDR family oxidoreductase n=1 Tax=Caldalkalibacillus thermarum (strain TA2.A1) TaxID=986075 RepID=F5L6G6_CALTT|nr:SDR family oxidoreductase [Caldalkalibacillus thermarum]EGL83076.1 short-chain dehydrogenase/reductase SDR [Caldalkalibacillus thermarum TA2.A1]QZT34912.1 SDR family oxidoreductase [Caldalkalibacillus thermarum TA2.A1]
MGRFHDQVVIVTGGGQGIGRALSCRFAEEEAKVVIADIDREAGFETLDTIQTSGKEAHFIRTDVADEDDVEQLVQEAVERYGKVDILINNAGIGHFESLFDIDVKHFDRVIAVNLRGTFLCSKYAAQVMKRQGKGVIINIASTRALMSEADSESYAASKGGILALTHAMAVSLGPVGIRVNAISPGWIETGEWKKAGERYTPQHSERDKLQHPVGRVGDPEDIVRAAFYLASDDAGFITGQNLIIDGGMTVKMIYEE